MRTTGRRLAASTLVIDSDRVECAGGGLRERLHTDRSANASPRRDHRLCLREWGSLPAQKPKFKSSSRKVNRQAFFFSKVGTEVALAPTRVDARTYFYCSC